MIPDKGKASATAAAYNRSMVRRVIAALAIAVCSMTPTGCVRKHVRPAAGQLTLGMVTDVGGLGDRSFNDSAYGGMLMSQTRLRAYIKVLQSKSAADYQPNLTVFSEAGFDMIYGIGFLMSEDVAQVARQFNHQRYTIIDAIVPAPNVVSVTFNEQDGSFLAGALAAMVSRSHHLGFIGGQDIPPIHRFQAGYIAGAHQIDPTATVDVKYVGSFDDVAVGKELANLLFNSGADIVYAAAGKAGLGVIDAVKSRPRGNYVIGVDSDQDGLAPGKILTSMIKHVDVAVFDVARHIRERSPLHGHVVLGLRDGAISLSDFRYTRDVVTASRISRLQLLQRAIANRQITVPDTLEGLAHWKAPAL